MNTGAAEAPVSGDEKSPIGQRLVDSSVSPADGSFQPCRARPVLVRSPTHTDSPPASVKGAGAAEMALLGVDVVPIAVVPPCGRSSPCSGSPASFASLLDRLILFGFASVSLNSCRVAIPDSRFPFFISR